MFKALMIYYIISIIYLLFQYRKDRKNIVIKLLIIIFGPFIGLIILYFMFHNIENDKDIIPDGLIEVDNEESEILRKVDVEKETSIVPMKDALLLNNNQTKRKMLMDILKNDSFGHIEILQTALKNDDTETSHYAATAIQDIIGKLHNSIHQMEFQLEKNPNDLTILTSFAQVIKQYLNIGFLDERSEKQYLYRYSQILGRLIEIKPYEKEHYIEKINCDLQLGDLETAEVFTQIFLQNCSNEEEAFFMAMKLYYILKDQLKFKEILQSLKGSPVRLSPQGLNKLRFWLHGDING